MNYQQSRNNMLAQQLRPYGVLEQKVLNIMSDLPRERFVPEKFRDCAYADSEIALTHQQIIMPPKEQGYIAQALAIKPTDTILEIGSGSGYLTALLAKLGKNVNSIEIFADLSEQAGQCLRELHIDNVRLITDDANHCWNKDAPYDVICITAGLPLYPECYKQGLAIGGRLFAIIGASPTMQAVMFTRTTETTWSEKSLFETVVPIMLNTPMPAAFEL